MSTYATHTRAVLATHSSRTAEKNMSFIIPYINDILLKTPSPKILDIGCGPGSITISLAKLFPTSHITGVEIRETPLIEARKLAASEGVTNVDFKVGDCHDLSALGIEDVSFDVVYCHQVLQHVKSPVAVLAEMRRVCVKGNGGFVAAKENADMSCFPDFEGMRLSNKILREAAAARGAHPQAGQSLHVWAKEAGFDSTRLVSSSSGNTHRTRSERELLGNVIGERFRVDGELGRFVIEKGICTAEELEMVRRAWKEWVDDDDRGWLVYLNGELLAFL